MNNNEEKQEQILKAYFAQEESCCCFMIGSILIAFIGFFITFFVSSYNLLYISIYLIISLGILAFFFMIIRWDSGIYCENCNKRVHPLLREHRCGLKKKDKKSKFLVIKLSIKLHPKVKEISLDLFNNGHYSQAIFESVKALNNFVKSKARIIDKDLAGAMAKAFNEQDPIIKLNDLITQSDKDEQEGFKFLYMGTMKGIRNPMGHETYEMDKKTAIEYLAFLSLLFRKAEEGKL